MIYEIYCSTGDVELVKRSLPALLKEYEFWNSGIMPKLLPIILETVYYLWLMMLEYTFLFGCPR